MPALGTPMASATAITPSGISSMAARVEIGLAQLSGVAKSSRTGTKRKVKAGPMMRSPLENSGFGPFIQQRLMPFFSSMVVIVAVVTLRNTSNSASLIARLAKRTSRRRHAEPFVAASKPGHQRNRQQHHPAFADDLTGKKSSEPKASQRNTIESTTSPTALEATTANTSRCRASGV